MKPLAYKHHTLTLSAHFNSFALVRVWNCNGKRITSRILDLETDVVWC
jgi:hypothetical protein